MSILMFQKKEFFQLDEYYLQSDPSTNNCIRKMGKNDSFIYSNISQFSKEGQKIQKKKQITAREYIELTDLKDPMKR